MRAPVAALTALALSLAAPAGGQERPSEEELFGAPRPETPPAAPGQAAAAAAPPAPRAIGESLALGGILYLRAATLAREEQAAADWAFASPDLLDVYLDARPNDRVRAFTLLRTFHDPTLGAEGSATSLPAIPVLSAAAPENPRFVLDQLWVNFDVGRTVFVTAGKQHVKWGVGKFWNPTDYLHPVKRDPLAVFDDRAGTSMLKVHLPWEKRGWNAYGVAFLEDLRGSGRATGRLGRVAGGGRVEVVLGTVELAADALVQDASAARYGLDASAGIWDLDVYAELALQEGTDGPRWREIDPAAPLNARYVREDRRGMVPRLVVGGSWGWRYSDEDTLFVGAEYSFDDAGYDDPGIYPFLLAGAPEFTGDLADPVRQRDPRAFTPFYLGRHYAGLYVSLPSPGRWNDTTFTLSLLGNLSDRSFVARLDHSLLALTHLRVETYLAGSFGHRDGEFRLGMDVPPQLLGQDTLGQDVYTPAFRVAPLVLQAGVAVRVSL